jgi:hypothetical protein
MNTVTVRKGTDPASGSLSSLFLKVIGHAFIYDTNFHR